MPTRSLDCAPMPGSPRPLELDRRTARRLCVQGQRLAGPRPASIAETVHDLWMVQLRPDLRSSPGASISSCSRASAAGSASRISSACSGGNGRSSSTGSTSCRRPTTASTGSRCAAIPDGPRDDAGPARRGSRRDSLRANAGFRRYVLRELGRRGPLRARDLEDRAVVPWRSGGWNDDVGRSVSMMLDLLWNQGEVMIVGRDGQQRLWDLAERTPAGARATLCPSARSPAPSWSVSCAPVGLRGRSSSGGRSTGRPPGWERALSELVREGVAVPAAVDGLGTGWFAHAEVLERPWRPRTVLLSPFDDLVTTATIPTRSSTSSSDWRSTYRRAKRRWGYFVLPILHGDRLIGRVDPRFDRRSGVLHLDAVHAEAVTRARDGAAAGRAIRELAGWLGASVISVDGAVPSGWRRSLDI